MEHTRSVEHTQSAESSGEMVVECLGDSILVDILAVFVHIVRAVQRTSIHQLGADEAIQQFFQFLLGVLLMLTIYVLLVI